MNKRIGSVFGSKAGLVTPIEDGLRMRLNETKIDGSVSDKVKSAILKQRGVDQKDSEPGLGDYINYLSKELNAANDTVDELIDTISDKETKIIEIEALLNNFGIHCLAYHGEEKLGRENNCPAKARQSSESAASRRAVRKGASLVRHQRQTSDETAGSERTAKRLGCSAKGSEGP
ncbi:MAG: hypothetical protein LBF25_01320 [Puniceicoccales bacterium]|jgi:ribonuclease BN (tRNA processing enzyme)|nr:hypothetical protein [Puniceicoccales bacterium]